MKAKKTKENNAKKRFCAARAAGVLAVALLFCPLAPAPTPFCVCAQNGVISAPVQDTLGSYTTYFDEEQTGRTQNIRLAVQWINGVTLQPYGTFSFNQTVGKRTVEAGFKKAKIIEDGRFVLGIGGGVCQVSTTLYNAALKSGLEILEYHPHSLKISYVAPSRDAMVSTQCDLKLYNPYPQPVRLHASVKGSAVQVSFLGKNTGDRWEIVSHVLEEIPPPPPIVEEGKTERIIRAPKNGVKSEAYLERYKDGKLVARTRIRTDSYKPVQAIVVKKNENTT